MSAILELRDGDDIEAILNSSRPVLIEAWTPTCGPCKTQMPVVDRLVAELGERIAARRLNAESNPELARRFAIRAVPTLLVLEVGHEPQRLLGNHGLEELRQIFRAILGSSARLREAS